jgi:outer membrane protein
MTRGQRLVMAIVLPAFLGGCNLWPGQLGPVELPASRAADAPFEPFALETLARSPLTSLEQDLEQVRSRQPEGQDEAPRAIREAEGGLLRLSISEVRRRALADSLDLDVALFDPEIARTRVSAEEGRFDALIGARLRYASKDTPALDGPITSFRSADPQLDGQSVKFTQVPQTTERTEFGLGVTVPLPTGGRVALESVLDQKEIIEPDRYEQYLAGARFSFSQPLLRNAGSEAAQASIRLARADQRISEVRTRLAALRVLTDAEKSYWRLYLARRTLDVRSEQFRLARENLELVQRRVAEGITPTVEITRAEVGVYRRVEALIRAETDWRLRQRDLKVRLGSPDLPLRGGPSIEVATDPLLAGLDLDEAQLVDRALAHRLDLIELELGIVRDGIQVGYRENQILPIANLDFSYGLLDRDSSLDRALRAVPDGDHPDFAVGLSFEIPFTNQRQRALLDEAVLARARRLATRSARELKVRQEVHDTVDILRQNWQRVLAARQSVVVAGVNYDAERRQFEQGMRTMREVLEALSDLGDAQLAELRAIVEYQVAQVDVAFATGTLLGHARVDLSPLAMPGFDPAR